MVFSWSLGINGDIGNIRFSWGVSGLGLSGRCPVQLEFDIFDPSDSVIDALAVPDFVVTPYCPELETKSQKFFVDSRRVSGSVCHVVCYDRMSRTDVPFSASRSWEEKMSASEALDNICRICGFEGHSMSGGALGGLQYISFTKPDVEGKTCGEILDIISEAMAGVWACSSGYLHLSCFGNSADGVIVSSTEHTELVYQGRTRVIGLVMKNSADGKEYSYGTTAGNGTVIRIESGFVSEDLAGIVSQRVVGCEYLSWDCKRADITTAGFGFGGLIQFSYSYSGELGSLVCPLFPNNVNYYVDSTGIYFSGGCASFDDWNYKSKLEREKIGIGKTVGNTSISENGRINFVNLN